MKKIEDINFMKIEDINFEDLTNYLRERPDLPESYGKKERYSRYEATHFIARKFKIIESNKVVDILIEIGFFKLTFIEEGQHVYTMEPK